MLSAIEPSWEMIFLLKKKNSSLLGSDFFFLQGLMCPKDKGTKKQFLIRLGFEPKWIHQDIQYPSFQFISLPNERMLRLLF